jgi:hypothetical protein
MFNYFYQFHKKELAKDLYYADIEDGTPSPPSSEILLDNDFIVLLDNDGQVLIE